MMLLLAVYSVTLLVVTPCVMSDSAQDYRLTYFDERARAEPLRYLFKLAGVDFINRRVPYKDWPQLRKGMYRLGQIYKLE